MTDRERLVKVMEYKQSCLPEEFQEIYFNEKDAKALRSLTDGKAEEAVSVMIDNINNKYYNDSALCPFCVLFYDDHNFCEGCEYQEQHGNCLEDDSGYSFITAYSESNAIREYIDLEGILNILTKEEEE